MFDRENGWLLMTAVIVSNYRNASLKRADDMREFLITVLTDKGFDKLVPFFDRRQTEEQYKAQIKVTTSTLSSLGKRLVRRFVKAARVSGIYKRIEIDGNEKAAEKLIAKTEAFYGRKSIEKYFLKYIDLYGLIDANAFYAIHFNNFAIGEEPTCYPVLWPCTQVVEFIYSETGTLTRLLTQQVTLFTDDKGVTRTLTDYFLYEVGRQTYFRELCDGRTFTNQSYIQAFDRKTVDGKGTNISYSVLQFDTKTDEVPCQRLGYELDAEDMNLCVSPIYAAEPHFRDYIKMKSNLDVTTLLHVYARLFQYAEKCPGEGSKGCNKGFIPATNPPQQCNRCKGLGYVTHSNAIDTIILPLPDEADKILPLDKMSFYLTPDIKVVDKLQEFLYELEYQKIPITVFGTEVLIRSNGSKVTDSTATESLLSNDQLNDTLRPFVDNRSDLWKFTVRQYAKFLDIKNVTAFFEYPADLAVESTSELLNQMKLATDSGANSQMIDLLSDKTMRVLLRDKPNELNRYEVQKRFSPFNGRSESERQYLLATTGLVPRRIKVLYSLFDTIIDELEEEQRIEKKGFYKLDYAKQNELIDAKLDFYIKMIDDETPSPQFNVKALPGGNTSSSTEDPIQVDPALPVPAVV